VLSFSKNEITSFKDLCREERIKSWGLERKEERFINKSNLVQIS